jgi:hypothetical protein
MLHNIPSLISAFEGKLLELFLVGGKFSVIILNSEELEGDTSLRVRSQQLEGRMDF